MDNIDTTTTDLVVLDAENIMDDSDNEGTSNVAIGAVCLAAGVAIGTFIVPPAVGFVRGLFSRAKTPEVAEQVDEIMSTAKESAKDNKVV